MTATSPERPAPSNPPSGAGRDGPPTEDLELLDVVLRVTEALRHLRFGTVLLVVQDGKVVQIETAEKIRL